MVDTGAGGGGILTRGKLSLICKAYYRPNGNAFSSIIIRIMNQFILVVVMSHAQCLCFNKGFVKNKMLCVDVDIDVVHN